MRDETNSEICTKCQGTGIVQYYSYHDNGECYRCDGTGRVMLPSVKQPRTAKPVRRLEDAVIGSIIAEHGTKYIVEAILWVRLKHGREENQKLITRRLIDDGERVYYRTATVASETEFYGALIDGKRMPLQLPIHTTDTMRGQPVEQNADGSWKTF